MYEITIIQYFLIMFILLQSCTTINSSGLEQSKQLLNYSDDERLKTGGGDQASLYEYTFMAILVKYDREVRRQITKEEEKVKKELDGGKGRLICGGAIIHTDWILTAARCFNKKPNLKLYEVYAGVVDLSSEVGQQIRLIQKVSTHPEYNSISDEFNIAMVKVTSPFTITTYVRAGYLPMNPLSIKGTERCHILGFVREYETDNDVQENGKYTERLIKVQLHAIDYKECSDTVKVLKAEKPYELTQKNYCLVQLEGFPQNNSQGACEGDVGGPSICGFKIQGVIAHYTNKTCYKTGSPTTIVDVGYHLNWIRSNILQLNILSRNLGIQTINFSLNIFYFPFLLLQFKCYCI